MSLARKLASPTHPAVEHLIADGAHVFDQRVDPKAAADLLAEIRATRHFDHRLFLSEAEFDADPQYTGVNPKPGRNLLERFEDRLGFVEQAPHIVEAVSAVLGPDYTILNKKVVCGVPQTSVPEWLRKRILGNPVNNLGAYVRPENRDVTYFYGIDFHQDLIDYKDRPADFLTLYVYLHPVTKLDAPLYLLTGTHVLGGTLFPHDLERSGPDHWTYRDRRGGQVEARQLVLTGEAGYAAMWHACTLHGTQPDAADHERISLRYLLAQGSGRAGIDEVNAALKGPLSLDETRNDLDAKGAAVIKANSVNKA
ncbi:hypothetical protein [Phenylobacterium sp.]|uniref:hypothetical protein n=1 Tax=Phenylobacterium sp. TaxID=1871053 RepID=UPI0035B202A2